MSYDVHTVCNQVYGSHERYQVKLKTQAIAWAGKVMTITYAKIGKKVVIDTSKFKNQEDAAEHGYTQRFGDLESGDDTGALKYDAAIALNEHYLNGGDWRMSAERDTTAEVIAAVHRCDPKKYTLEKLHAAVAKNPEQVKTWRAHVRVKEMIARTRAEKAAAIAKQSTDELVINL